MENSSDNPQSSVADQPQVSNINYSPLPPQAPPAPQVKKSIRKNIVIAFVLILIVVSAVGVLYFYFSKSPKTYNATMYTPPKTVKASPSPTPTTEPLINKNDNSNRALDSDSSLINKDINTASSDLNGVNQSFSDQQTNLQ